MNFTFERLLAILCALFITETLFGQNEVVFSATYKATRTFTLSHNGGSTKFILSDDKDAAFKPAKETSDKLELAKFLREKISAQLTKNKSATNEESAINVYVNYFAEDAINNEYVRKLNTIIRKKELDKLHTIMETWTDQNKYLIYIENRAKVPPEPIDVYIYESSRYQYASALNGNDLDYVLKNIGSINDFIAENEKLNAPDITVNYQDKTVTLDYITGAPNTKTGVAVSVLDAIVKNLTPDKGTGLFKVKKAEYKDGEVKDKDKELDAGSKKKEVAKQERISAASKIACTTNKYFELETLGDGLTSDTFLLVINTLADHSEIQMSFDVSLASFTRSILQDKTLKDTECKDAEAQKKIEDFYQKLQNDLKSYKEKQALKKQNAEKDKAIDSFKTDINYRILALAGEQDFAALLHLNPKVPLNVNCNSGQVQGTGRGFAAADHYLAIDSIKIFVTNNIIYQIDIVGSLDGTDPMQTLSNNGYGITLRDLVDGRQTISFSEKGNRYELCYSNLFKVRFTEKDAIAYNLADSIYTFFPARDSNDNRDKQKLVQKRFLDFVSASVFTDILAFNKQSPNKNLLTELYLTHTINDKGGKFWIFPRLTPFRYSYLTMLLGLNLMKDNESFTTIRKRVPFQIDTISRNTAITPTEYKFDTTFSTRYYFNAFDLYKYANFQVRPMINVLTADLKVARTLIEANFGGLFMSSSGKFIDPLKGTDSIFTQQVYSVGALNELRIRINPKPNYGLDLRFTYCYGLNPLSEGQYPITGKAELESLVRANRVNENNNRFWHLELGFYFNLKKAVSAADRGGLYFKFNHFKAVEYPVGQYMFLVGYSTDIKNFFK